LRTTGRRKEFVLFLNQQQQSYVLADLYHFMLFYIYDGVRGEEVSNGTRVFDIFLLREKKRRPQVCVCFGGGLDIINLSADSCACDDHYSKFASFFSPKIRLLLLSNVNGLQAKYIAEEGSPRLCVCGAIKSIQGKRTVPSSLTLCVWVDPDVCFCLFADR
jgi:hypothetical protein